MIVLISLLLAAAAAGGSLDKLTKEIAASGQVVDVVTTPSERVSPAPQIAPGPPPMLAFRYYEGQRRHRFSNAELMLDDAGH